jgi:hypothetical protein
MRDLDASLASLEFFERVHTSAFDAFLMGELNREGLMKIRHDHKNARANFARKERDFRAKYPNEFKRWLRRYV